jgi:hypothetical protein
MLACTVRILPDQPLVGQHSNADLGVARKGAASAVRGGYPACGSACTPSGLRVWAECARDAAHPLRSVTGCRATSLPRASKRAGVEGAMSQLAAGAGRGVYVCQMDPRHGHDPRCGGETSYIERVLLRSRAVKVSGTPPAAADGLAFRCVVCGSEQNDNPNGRAVKQRNHSPLIPRDDVPPLTARGWVQFRPPSGL